MTISGGRTEQLDIFCRVTGFTSDFLSFTVVELIRFFHGAIIGIVVVTAALSQVSQSSTFLTISVLSLSLCVPVL